MMSIDFEKRQNELRGTRIADKEAYEGGVRKHVIEQEHKLRHRVAERVEGRGSVASTDGTEKIPGAL